MRGYSSNYTCAGERDNSVGQYFSWGYQTSGYSKASHPKTKSSGRSRYRRYCARNTIQHQSSQSHLIKHNFAKRHEGRSIWKFHRYGLDHGRRTMVLILSSLSNFTRLFSQKRRYWGDIIAPNSRTRHCMRSIGRKRSNSMKSSRNSSLYSWWWWQSTSPCGMAISIELRKQITVLF